MSHVRGATSDCQASSTACFRGEGLLGLRGEGAGVGESETSEDECAREGELHVEQDSTEIHVSRGDSLWDLDSNILLSKSQENEFQFGFPRWSLGSSNYSNACEIEFKT